MLASLKELALEPLLNREFYPSPAAWEDEVLYFLMLDRFSDGKEKGYLNHEGQPVNGGSTPMFTPADRGNATRTPAQRQAWFEAGGRFAGGTLRGLESKIGYLRRMGITALWISPIFRQSPWAESYHGYGIQNFLDVDPRFGTREDLVQLVNTAHQHGIRVILDIILNHSGDVFAYREEDFRCEGKAPDGTPYRYPCWQADGFEYGVKGWRDATGAPTIPFGPPVSRQHFPGGAIWPEEFQAAETFSRRGEINNWDYDPEYREGDFFSLKDIKLGSGAVDEFRPSAALMNLGKVYSYWIALADIDGFRVDTVKHMDDGASRIFTSIIHEFAERIGKDNFYLIGEITGGRQHAFNTLETIGMDAALGINEIPDKLEYLVKGFRDPQQYFSLFRNSMLVQKNSHVWFRNRVVTTFDDHDQVRKGNNKARFCYDEPGQADNHLAMLNVLALMVCSLGIPCIYYGSEQCFDGHGDNDRYLRECMFGGEFGAFESRNRHFFDENTFVYQELAKVLAIRRQHIPLRRGRQYLREISGDGLHFGLPRKMGDRMKSVVAWSRIHSQQEVLLAINTDYHQPTTAWVTIDNGLHQQGEKLRCLYSRDAAQIGSQLAVEARNGKAVRLQVPAAGFVIYE
ncbi:MAG: alpha-amylase [Bacteroidetes bacterium]|nr:MAG: alpha-amylase [Bacteroidota bacterium]